MNWTEIFYSFEFQAILKLLLGALLTGIIGLERSSLNKPAGFGTHAILGVSAVLLVLSSEFLSQNYDIDMARIPAQLLSGIGFIGAGTILRNGVNIKGVTTATAILSVTCIGLAVGAGFYVGAIFATLVVYLILSYAHDISSKFERSILLDLEIKVKEHGTDVVEKIEKYFEDNKIELEGMKRNEISENKKEEIIEVILVYDTYKTNKNKIIKDLVNYDYVIEVNVQS